MIADLSLDMQNPYELNACFLDDYAAAWARRLRIAVSQLAREDSEPDVFYRPRLLDLIHDKVEPRA